MTSTGTTTAPATSDRTAADTFQQHRSAPIDFDGYMINYPSRSSKINDMTCPVCHVSPGWMTCRSCRLEIAHEQREGERRWLNESAAALHPSLYR